MRSNNGSVTAPAAAGRHPPAVPLCEGWVEKYALCRGVFASKGWHRRYTFLTCDGLGFTHTNPREKTKYPANVPLRASMAKSFIPFARRRHGAMELEPVYVIDDISASKHPAVPRHSHNGICSEAVSTAEGGNEAPGDRSTNAVAVTGSVVQGGKAGSSTSCTYYYFGLTFEEHRKRYLLLLRTDSPQDYIKWTTYLPLFVHEGSATRLVPLGHPLEVGRPQPVDLNRRRLSHKRESALPGGSVYYYDPDPCSAEECMKLRRMCLAWDEGAYEGLLQAAVARVESLCGKSASTASSSLSEQQSKSEEDFRRSVNEQFDELGPSAESDTEARSPNQDSHSMHPSNAGSPIYGCHVDARDFKEEDVTKGARKKRRQSGSGAAGAGAGTGAPARDGGQ